MPKDELIGLVWPGLVVEDNKLNRLLLCRSLELRGHEVASVVNGREALEKLRSERFDLLLLDLAMPEVERFALLELRAADPVLREIPVIVTSALEGAVHVARYIELGADDYLQKPPKQGGAQLMFASVPPCGELCGCRHSPHAGPQEALCCWTR